MKGVETEPVGGETRRDRHGTVPTTPYNGSRGRRVSMSIGTDDLLVTDVGRDP